MWTYLAADYPCNNPLQHMKYHGRVNEPGRFSSFLVVCVQRLEPEGPFEALRLLSKQRMRRHTS